MLTTREHPETLEGRSATRLYTYAELVVEMPESTQPCELWNGELIMSPAPSFYHQKIVLRFYKALDSWVAARKLGEVITAPVDMVLSPHLAVQPDVAFIARDRLEIVQQIIQGPADLVAEVVSQGGGSRDRIEKRDLYEQHGVKEYWVIDPEPETVEVFFLEASRFVLMARSTRDQTASSRLLPGFEVPVGLLFHGE